MNTLIAALDLDWINWRSFVVGTLAGFLLFIVLRILMARLGRFLAGQDARAMPRPLHTWDEPEPAVDWTAFDQPRLGPDIPSASPSPTIPDAAFDDITNGVIAEIRRKLKEV